MAARYQHLTDPVRSDVAKRVDGLIWKKPKVKKKGKKRRKRGDDDGSAGVPVPA